MRGCIHNVSPLRGSVYCSTTSSLSSLSCIFSSIVAPLRGLTSDNLKISFVSNFSTFTPPYPFMNGII